MSRLRRAIWAAGNLFRRDCPRPMFECVMVTLTYRPGAAWSRRHISEWLAAARRSLPRGVRLRYVWCMELQRRGAPHYHVLVWLPNGIRLPKPDQSGQWRHGLSRIELCLAPIGYLTKYVTKGGELLDQGQLFPRNARIFGIGGLEREGRIVVRHWMLPRYVRDAFDASDRVIRAKGGGWVSLRTGQWLAAAVAVVDQYGRFLGWRPG